MPATVACCDGLFVAIYTPGNSVPEVLITPIQPRHRPRLNEFKAPPYRETKPAVVVPRPPEGWPRG